MAKMQMSRSASALSVELSGINRVTLASQHMTATGITNARTEGYNRLAKQAKRAACGFRNPANSARRIRFHCTRKQRAVTRTSY